MLGNVFGDITGFVDNDHVERAGRASGDVFTVDKLLDGYLEEVTARTPVGFDQAWWVDE